MSTCPDKQTNLVQWRAEASVSSHQLGCTFLQNQTRVNADMKDSASAGARRKGCLAV